MRSLLIFVWLLLPNPSFGDTNEQWYLPRDLSVKNTEVQFELDSTWHVVKGQIKDLSGRIELEDPKDPGSVRGQVNIPVLSFDTGNDSRDEQMRSVMASQEFPEVTFRILNKRLLCTPRVVRETGSCNDSLSGVLTIRGLSKAVDIPVTIKSLSSGYEVTGALAIRWGEFKVEDPSILVAKVAPIVTVSFTVTLGPNDGGDT